MAPATPLCQIPSAINHPAMPGSASTTSARPTSAHRGSLGFLYHERKVGEYDQEESRLLRLSPSNTGPSLHLGWTTHTKRSTAGPARYTGGRHVSRPFHPDLGERGMDLRVGAASESHPGDGMAPGGS